MKTTQTAYSLRQGGVETFRATSLTGIQSEITTKGLTSGDNELSVIEVTETSIPLEELSTYQGGSQGQGAFAQQ